MAGISDLEMAHLKTLARLELDPEETRSLKEDLNKILKYFEQLQELETEGVEELARPVVSSNVFREDMPHSGLSQAQALALAVVEEEGFFKVPRTVE